jgi:hypothetical protein
MVTMRSNSWLFIPVAKEITFYWDLLPKIYSKTKNLFVNFQGKNASKETMNYFFHLLKLQKPYIKDHTLFMMGTNKSYYTYLKENFPFKIKELIHFPNDCINFWENNSESYIKDLIDENTIIVINKIDQINSFNLNNFIQNNNFLQMLNNPVKLQDIATISLTNNINTSILIEILEMCPIYDGIIFIEANDLFNTFKVK